MFNSFFLYLFLVLSAFGQDTPLHFVRWPTDSHVVTSPFGERVNPVTGQVSFHKGVDIRCQEGDPIYAPADSQVMKITGGDDARGNGIEMIHKAVGWSTVYYHLGEVQVNLGEQVKAGDQIAVCGVSGMSTGPHLHFATLYRGKFMDPMTVLPQVEESTSH